VIVVHKGERARRVCLRFEDLGSARFNEDEFAFFFQRAMLFDLVPGAD